MRLGWATEQIGLGAEETRYQLETYSLVLPGNKPPFTITSRVLDFFHITADTTLVTAVSPSEKLE